MNVDPEWAEWAKTHPRMATLWERLQPDVRPDVTQLWSDGSSSHPDLQSGSAAVILVPQDNRVWMRSRYLGVGGPSLAELDGLLLGLESIKPETPLDVFVDNSLCFRVLTEPQTDFMALKWTPEDVREKAAQAQKLAVQFKDMQAFEVRSRVGFVLHNIADAWALAAREERTGSVGGMEWRPDRPLAVLPRAYQIDLEYPNGR